ncbi:AGAP007056-PA [Anopheles gambiae str. PEST]|uniref:AGAP007056-PA n=3 Tax=gambiae species complex TaxID=44542 RepID=Q7PF68_ANOGA|nr:neuropeptide SIFamide [Anopheles coluzzii]EAA45440.3 AGAP007056-PA [Anopheles gambiae str. PEST]
MAAFKVLGSLIVVLLVVLALSGHAEAGYRKPPFNGSIFGKRNGNSVDYEGNAKVLSTMCEIAAEACQSWFTQEQK